MFDLMITNGGPGTAVLATQGEFGMAAGFGVPRAGDRPVARPRTANVDKSIRRTGDELRG